MANIYSQVNNTYYDDSCNYYTIDTWKTDDENEEGKVVAVVNGTTADVFYIEPIARFDEKVKNSIKERVEAIRNEKKTNSSILVSLSKRER